jgi:hypothetical protein
MLPRFYMFLKKYEALCNINYVAEKERSNATATLMEDNIQFYLNILN